MRYKLLGKSGLRVSELCLGTMTFGEDWGWGSSKEESQKIYDAFRSAGGNFIDTANVYTNGTSEKFLGEFIASNREYVVLATKYSNGLVSNDPKTTKAATSTQPDAGTKARVLEAYNKLPISFEAN